MLAIVGISRAHAAPKDTLPPGFYSTPLAQPEDESGAKPENQQPTTPPPNEEPNGGNGQSSFLPLLEKNLLLPMTTGLLYGKAGLGEEVWLEGETETIIRLLNAWQVKLRSRPVAELARRLLLTHASTPPAIDPFDFIKIRLTKIYQLGDIRSLAAFFSRFPVLASDPKFSLLYEQKAFAQGVADGKVARAGCALWKANQRLRQSVSEPQLPIEQQIAALCLGFSGQTGRSLSEAEDLSDSGRAPREFFPLLTAALNSDPRSQKRNQTINAAPREINTVLWSLYKIVKRQPRYIYMDNVEAVLLPSIARDQSLSYNWRLAAAQHAILRGLVSSRFLQNFYTDRPRERTSQVPPRRPSERTRSQTNLAQVFKVSNILATAPNRTAYMAMLHSWARDIAFSDPKNGYKRADGLRASLVLNNAARMKAWLGDHGRSDGRSDDRSDPRSILPMRAILAALENSKRSPHRGIAPQVIESWQKRTDLLVKVIGKEFFDIDASGLPDPDDTEEGDALMDAIDNEARTEIILRVLVGMDNTALARAPSFLRAVIQGLSAVGLKKEAWRIVMDAFLTEAWGP